MVLFDYLFLLLLGHVLGDFYFQTEKMATAKDKKYVGVILHSLEYAVTIVVVVFPVISLDMLLAATYLSVIHFDIDTEESELAHLELIATIVRQLTKGLSAKELDSKNFYAYNPSFD